MIQFIRGNNVADYIDHMTFEETVLMAEPQRLFSDAEIRQIDAESYHQMEPAQMVHMMEVLMPQSGISSSRICTTKNPKNLLIL
jgi:hypothetical protein